MNRDASKIVFCDGEGKVKMEFDDTGEIKALIGVGPVGEASYEAGYEDGAAAEREACAKIAEPKGPRPCDCAHCWCIGLGDVEKAERVAQWDADMATANAIRARGEK